MNGSAPIFYVLLEKGRFISGLMEKEDRGMWRGQGVVGRGGGAVGN